MSFFTSDGVEQLALKDYTERAYLDYSMYVINDRALPFIGDGLKPVQRRIIYAMSELGLDAAAKYAKSARTIGDVLGKFHPHGDSACYEAMVLMAQPFSYRYPLVDGQGNWGAPDDPKSFAAMRYTEAKLTKYSRVLLEELGQGTVDYVPNFDGSLDEPSRLPAKLPNILLNGGTGIAVGMATDIPPHNLNEVASACIHLLDEPKATLEDILEHIKAPDYPTEAEIITPADELKKIYQSGKGSVRARAVYHLENGEIVITALPYQVSGNKILEQIAAQMQAKKLPMVADLRDESDHENPTRLVVVPRSNRVDCEAIMQHLFASTGLENSYRVNFNMIGINGNPAVKSLLEILVEWLEYRTETVTRRLSHRLSKILARLHILEGMMIAYLNIDEVIRIVREEDKPKAALMSAFGISDLQAESILNIRLRQLAKLEEIKIRGEQDELNKERKGIEKILGSKARMKTLLRKEILAAAKEYGDDRRSPLVERRTAQAFREMDLVSSDPVTVVLSEKGWIRAAKGHEVNALELNYKSGDGFKTSVQGKSNQSAIFMDSTGRVYTLAAHTLPSARGQGEPLSGRLNIPSGATIEGLLMSDLEDYYLLASDAGYGFVTQLKDMVSKNKAGKVTLTLPPGGKVIAPIAIKDVENSSIVAISNEGRMLVFPVTALPVMARGKGNKIMNIPAARVSDRLEFLAALKVVSQEQTLVVHSGKRHIKLRYKDLEHYIGERARRGSKLPRGFQRVDSVEIG